MNFEGNSRPGGGYHLASAWHIVAASLEVFVVCQSALAFALLPAGVDPVAFLVLGLLSALVMGSGKAGFAGGVGLLSVPLMIHACGGRTKLALGIMLPLLIACDYVSMALWWRRWDWSNVRLLLGGMVAGVGAGWLALYLFDEFGAGEAGKETTDAALGLSIGLIALGFVALQVFRSLRGEVKAFRPGLGHGALAGSAAGLTSTIAHAAGPIITMYLLPQRIPKGRYVATTVLYYWIGNQVKLIPYYERELLALPALAAGLVLLPAVVAGALLGVFLHKRVNERLFRIIVHLLLGGVGLHLVIASAWKLLGWGDGG